ncbi:M23 family metallopeptidase [Hirschia litorea]|uniref:Peptidoglycan DD-metalloendopeptidase family protein n=1 Tax=Hirschia litorea TaxID=1199156 RepID=A0ABW2IMR2_9PROT
MARLNTGQLSIETRRVSRRPLSHAALLFLASASMAFVSGCDLLLEPENVPASPRPTPSSTPTQTPEPIETTTPTPDVDEDVEPDVDVEQPVPTDETIPKVPDDEPATPPTEEPTPEPTPEPTQTPTPTPTSPEPEPTETPSPEPSETPTPAPIPTNNVSPAFSYHPPGDLEPNSGLGAKDPTIYVPDMLFPIKQARAYPQSQVYRYGGGIGGGDQCDPRNFTASWRDNFCENRSSRTTSPYCPSAGVHVGQDIRVGTPEGCRAERSLLPSERKRYVVVAAEDGYISNIGSYTVNVRAGGRIYRYMHMNMKALEVSLGQQVKAGDPLGYVSNDFGGTPTTLHLHFEIKHNTSEYGWTWAPPYTSLVKAYERREQAPGEMVVEE